MPRILLVCSALILIPAAASAQRLDEVRLGVVVHNICGIECSNADKEDGPNISGEIQFASPGFSRLILSPKPYLVASVNTAGKTSFGGAGLNWQWAFAERWSLEPGLGYVIHDGDNLNFPFPQGDPRNDPVSAENLFLGSRDLFRLSLSVNRDLGERWGMQLMYEHLSHGQILGSGRNQGIDNAGLRLRYRFGR
jgi:lipid A 3-O-deacylase